MTVRKLALTMLASLVLVTTSSAIAGSARAQDTAAVAINTKDDSSLFKLAFGIKRVMGDVVDQSNAAVAFASCEACQTVALSYQVVLVLSDPEIVSPENLALALNFECTLCETMASAYQYVLTTGGPVHLSPEANMAIAELRQRLQDLRNSDATMEEIAAEADAIAEELFDVISTGLVQGSGGEGADTSAPDTTTTPAPDDGETPAESPTTETTPSDESATPEPGESTSPTDEGSPTSEPSPDGSASPTPEPSQS